MTINLKHSIHIIYDTNILTKDLIIMIKLNKKLTYQQSNKYNNLYLLCKLLCKQIAIKT